MVARALAESGGEPEGFTDSLARQLRRWMLSIPPGVGFATARGTLRLLLGVSPRHSGVFSAGNGPAMRSALLGVCARDDAHLVDLVRASTCMTHTDPRALDGAVFIARVARQAPAHHLDAAIVDEIRDDAFRARVCQAWASEADLETFRVEAGFERGVSGFVVHTVPAVVHLRAPTSGCPRRDRGRGSTGRRHRHDRSDRGRDCGRAAWGRRAALRVGRGTVRLAVDRARAPSARACDRRRNGSAPSALAGGNSAKHRVHAAAVRPPRVARVGSMTAHGSGRRPPDHSPPSQR